MTDIPDVRWSPTSGLMVMIQGGRARFLDLTEHNPIALPEDAVPLEAVPAVMRGERAGAIKGGTIYDWVGHMVAEYTAEVGAAPPLKIVTGITVAVLREMGWEKRPQSHTSVTTAPPSAPVTGAPPP